MKVLCIGDVVGTTGIDFLRRVLPDFKRNNGVDVCIVNGENSSDGNGITPASAEHIFKSGADVITTGNHAYRRREMYTYYDDSEFVIRPANFSDNNPGKGFCVLDKGRVQVGVINLMGTMYMDPLSNPFDIVDKLLDKPEFLSCKIKMVDFHAEATSEKRAMGFYLAGRVSAVCGTHTHVQTADEQILPGGTGYITDLGMTGTVQSVLGVDSKIVIDKFKYNMPTRFDFVRGSACLCGALFEIDDKSGEALSVSRVLIKE